ncbi:MAG TPA: glutamyl-tRNA reductase [Candidatus Bathyarchaeia archaeon]|nr:glutamyl-tRNA reductase [Candidatus Bathyarchaeia archaeon]
MLVNVGVTYRRAPLATLDALTIRDLPSFYKLLRGIVGVKGAVVVQTCNRVDFFLDVEDGAEVEDQLFRNWALECKFKLHELRRITEQRTGEQVLSYLVSLASGLESMLIGENQILGQLRSSLIEARGHVASSPTLSQTFEMSFAAGAKIREQTGIGRGSVSLGSAALKLAEEALGPLDNTQVLLLGTGEIGMIMMKALRARGIADVSVAGGSRQRTETFCRTFGGKPFGMADAISNLALFSLAIVATKATGYLLTKEIILPNISPDHKRKLVILDLSLPSNVSSDVGQIEGIMIKTMDDLREITEQTASLRRKMVREAQPLVEQEVQRISSLLRREEAEPMVSDLYHRAERIRREELEKALSKLDLTRTQREILEKMSLSLVQKLLSQPVVNLREAAKKGDTELLTVAGQIFGD